MNTNIDNKWTLVQTEKAYTVQQNNTYILVSFNKNLNTNKIELAKLLKGKGLNVTKITSTASQQKTKVKGKARKEVTQFRPKKWYITLKPGEILTEETVKAFN